MQADMLIDGELTAGEGARRLVSSPYDGRPVGEAAEASEREIEAALSSAWTATQTKTPRYAGGRAEILEAVAALATARSEEFANLIASEQGKTLAEARKEASRVPALLRLCAGEARRLGMR